MAILSAILSLIGRELSTILQAIFGWSITALFGRLPQKKQTALTVALVLSIVWPLLVVGCFLPGAAAWAVAFIPLHKWIGDLATRFLWIGLAVIVPLGVGAITRWVTPKDKLRGGIALTLLGGYVLTLGYFIAFLVTALTVPIVKATSALRGWSDCHVYVQPKEGRYAEVLACLTEACARANVSVVREDVPVRMAIASRVVEMLARPFLEPNLGANPQRLRAQDVELYLYAADLLVRGKPHTAAHVRASMTRTKLATHAYLVEDAEAQTLQDEIEHLWKAYEEQDGSVADRLRDVSARLDRAPISFDEWTTLETSLRRIEHAVVGGPDLLEQGSDGAKGDVRARRREGERTSHHPSYAH